MKDDYLPWEIHLLLCIDSLWLWFLLLQAWFAENKGVLKSRKIRLTFIIIFNQIDWQNYESFEIKTVETLT